MGNYYVIQGYRIGDIVFKRNQPFSLAIGGANLKLFDNFQTVSSIKLCAMTIFKNQKEQTIFECKSRRKQIHMSWQALNKVVAGPNLKF